MEFVHKAHLSDCCVKGCARHASCSQSVHWRAPRIWPAQTKHPLRLPSRSRFACHEGSFTLTIKSMSSHIYLQSKEHHHEHASAHHEDAMEVDSHDSEQHPTAHPLKPFSELKRHQQWERVNRFAGGIWEPIVHAAMDILHCESFDLKRIEFTVDGQEYAIAFTHERHSISHLSTLSEEERSQVFMVSIFVWSNQSQQSQHT